MELRQHERSWAEKSWWKELKVIIGTCRYGASGFILGRIMQSWNTLQMTMIFNEVADPLLLTSWTQKAFEVHDKHYIMTLDLPFIFRWLHLAGRKSWREIVQCITIWRLIWLWVMWMEIIVTKLLQNLPPETGFGVAGWNKTRYQNFQRIHCNLSMNEWATCILALATRVL